MRDQIIRDLRVKFRTTQGGRRLTISDQKVWNAWQLSMDKSTDVMAELIKAQDQLDAMDASRL